MKTGPKPILLVLTASYPFSVAAEGTFLAPEISCYRNHFSRIVMVPQDLRGERMPVAEDIEVDTSLAEGLQAKWRVSLLIMGLLSWGFYRELRSNPHLLKTPAAVLRMALTRGRVEWIVGWFKRLRPDSVAQPPMVVYAFWLDKAILAAGLYRARGGQARVIARAHGGDLYSERHSPAHISFQGEMVALADCVAPDSLAGSTYLRNKYPRHSGKIRVALLGTEDPGFRTAASTDGVVRIVSCAFLVGVKRVDLLVLGIAELAKRNEGLSIEWTHFGDGPLMSEIRSLATVLLPSQVRWALKGHVDTSCVYEWYREHPVDVFINVSSSEGTPVSIMEAISCYIPVIATSVGGNKEIVQESLGQLIPSEPTAQNIAEAIEQVCLDRQRIVGLKAGSRAHWERNYSAAKNYSGFLAVLNNFHGEHLNAAKEGTLL